MLESSDIIIHEIGNNSSLVLSLANSTSELILPRLTNDSTIIIGFSNNTTQDALNLSTLFGVLIGFTLSQAAEHLKTRRELIARNKKLLSLLAQDWETNRLIIANNISRIAEDDEAMTNSRLVVVPLEPLVTGFWDLIKSNLPNKLIDDKILINIRNIAIITMRINEYIQSREAFRINNMGIMDTKPNRIIYNKILLTEMNTLLSYLITFRQIYTYDELRD